MDVQDSCPVIVTENLQACRDFLRQLLRLPGGLRSKLVRAAHFRRRAHCIDRRHPSAASVLATRPGAFTGDGAFVTLQVAEAGLEYERVIGPGLRCDLPLPDEPWGQRRFGITDPAGAWIDVVEQMQPEDGWWDPYLREQA
jgi:hypothetical protein